jgi:gas vesicle structural protein
MSVMSHSRPSPNRYIAGPNPSGLYEVLDLILDKGLVIDAYIRVSLVGIELVTIDLRIVVASVDTYLRFAEAVNRLDLTETQVSGLPDLFEDLNEGGASGKAKGAISGAKEKVSEYMPGGGDEDESEGEEQEQEQEQES